MNKHIITTGIFLLFSTIAFGQKNENLLRISKTELASDQSTQLNDVDGHVSSIRLKSSANNVLLCDSSITKRWDVKTSEWVLSAKSVYSYDARGNKTRCTSCSWNITDKKWLEMSRTESTYDNLNNQLTSILYDNISDIQTPVNKSVYTYDSNKNNTSAVSYNWDANSKLWVGVSKTEQKYNLDNKEIYSTHSSWSDTDNDWFYQSKTESSYDQSGNKTLSESFLYNSTKNEWIKSSIVDIVYNTDNKLTSQSNFEWDESNSKWIPSSKNEFTYDENGNNTVNNTLAVNSVDHSWYISYQEEMMYDSESNMSQKITSIKSIKDPGLLPLFKLLYTYENNKKISTVIYKWNETTKEWQFSSTEDKIENSYDTDGNLVNQLKSKWNTTSSTWGNNIVTDFYYTAFVTSDPDSTISVSVSPNPASEYLICSFDCTNKTAQFVVCSAEGGQFFSKDIQSGEKVDVSSFPQGVYFYKLSLDGTIHNGTLIKN